MKKILVILSVALLLCAVLIFICFNGITIYIHGVCCINTKYYNNGNDAFFKDYSPTAYEITSGNVIGSLQEITTVTVDDNNAFYIAKADTGVLVVVPLKIKGDDKCFAYGDYSQFEINGDYSKPAFQSSNRIVNGFWFSGDIYWSLLNYDIKANDNLTNNNETRNRITEGTRS